MARNSAASISQIAETEKNVSTRKSAECTGLRAVITRKAEITVIPEKT